MKIIGMILLIILILFCTILVYTCLCASHEAEEMGENEDWKANKVNQKNRKP